MKRGRSFLVALAAAAVVGAEAAAAVHLAAEGPPALRVPVATVRTLLDQGVALTAARVPDHGIDAAAVRQRTPRNLRNAITGTYIVRVASSHMRTRCVCWMVVYRQGLFPSSFGVPDSFAADFYDAGTGSFVFGLSFGRVHFGSSGGAQRR